MENNNKNPKRRRNHTPGHNINLICLLSVLVLFSVVTMFNLFQTDRATVSESENRTLAQMPVFSFDSLFDGSYYKGLTDFFSDTFIGREKLISISESFRSTFGFDYVLNGEKYRYVDVGGDTPSQDETVAGEDTFIDITLPPVTTKPVTTAEITSGDPSDVTYTPDETTEIPFKITSVTLSNDSLSITEGTSRTLNAIVDFVGSGAMSPISFSMDKDGIVSLETNGSTANIKAIKAGTVKITATVGSMSAVCTVTVKEDNEVIGFTDSNLFIYGDALYNPVSYKDKTLQSAAGAYSKCLSYLSQVLGGARVSALPAPHNTSILDTTAVKKAGRNQGEMLDVMKSNYGSDINFVNAYNLIWSHRDEYLYFKTGYHWTARGAYYGYQAFMESIGETATPISALECKTLNESWLGEQGSFLTKHGMSDLRDKVEAYVPNVSCKMTITIATAVKNSSGKTTGYTTSQLSYQSAIVPNRISYLAFIGSDNPLTVITSPEVTNGKTILVLKDSYGCALVPYLTMNYSKIVVVDPRYYYRSYTKTIQEQLSDYKFDDVLVVMNIVNFNGDTFRKNIYNLIGITVE